MMSRNIAALNAQVQDRCFAIPHDLEVMHVGRRIKRLMQEKGIGNERAAAACGVTPGAVSNWFATGQITRDNLVVIADLLGESVRYLMTGDERDRALSVLESEFARRDVPAGTLEAVLTLVRACPLRRDSPIEREEPASDADAEAFRRATRPIEVRAPGSGRKRH